MITRYVCKFWSRFVLPRSRFDVYSSRELSGPDTSDERLSRYDFWEKRYKRNDPQNFDWFIDSRLLLESIYQHFEDLLSGNPGCQLRYLELGCGTSELPLSVCKHSSVPVSVFALDYIQEAVHQQSLLARKEGSKRKENDFQGVCGDVLNLPFQKEAFDLAVDKGTMDALIKNRHHGHRNSSLMLKEVMKCLRTGGRFIQISDEDPDTRIEFLDSIGKIYNSCTDATVLNVTQKSLSLKKECNKNSVEFELKDMKSSSLEWAFKVVADEKWNKEYFMYWTEKS